jgi:hypothetical protein
MHRYSKSPRAKSEAVLQKGVHIGIIFRNRYSNTSMNMTYTGSQKQ